MEYWEIIKTISLIPIEDRIISLDYDIWDTFDIKNEEWIYKITIEKWYRKKSPSILFNAIVNSTNSNILSSPKMLNLSCEQSLEMLFNHYPYWYDNKSNCVLFNTSNNILWIQYNNLSNTTFLRTDSPFTPKLIIVNNKKQIKWVYKIKEYKNLFPILKKICAE